MPCWRDSPDVFGMLYAAASKNIERESDFSLRKKDAAVSIQIVICFLWAAYQGTYKKPPKYHRTWEVSAIGSTDSV